MFAALLLAPLLVFRGNVALLEDVYRSFLDLPANTRATEDTAHQIAVRLSRFLHRAGYGLATVRAHAQGEQIVVDVDEGRLDKVIFLGGGAFETLRLRLELHLQNDVFNKYELERQLRALAKRLGLGEFAYEIVPVANAPPSQVQLDDIDPLERFSFGVVRPGRPYELHILIQPGVFRPSLSPELEINSIEGAGVGATYHSGRLFFDDDRWQLGGRVAGEVRHHLDGSGAYGSFTRALGEAEYDAPPIASVVRPSLRGRADLSDRQRGDLGLESFKFFTLDVAAQILFVPIPHIRASVGAGLERRLLFNVEPIAGALYPSSYNYAQTRPYGETSVILNFNPAALRRDRHHLLSVGARVYGPSGAGSVHLGAGYQKMFALGWNELWIEARGASKTGAILFPEESSIGGEVLRGPFGGQYARRFAGVGLEYRISLMRDVVKLGVFYNFAGYGAINRATNAEKLAGAHAVGPGFHALLIDEFQLDAYFGVGWSTQTRGPDTGAALAIRQAF